MPHTIQVFSGGCDLCRETTDMVEVGKCKDCKMEVLDVKSQANTESVKRYGITAVPSIVIDGKIKVVGKPTFAWFCGDDFYKMLEREYPLKANKRLDLVSSIGGGLGAALCTVTMLLPIIIGTAGAGASVACSMPGMCGAQLTGVLGDFVNGITQIAQPLTVASVALILYGMKRFGKRPLAISAVGGGLLYVSMFLLNMSLPLIAVSSAILILAYVIAFRPIFTIHDYSHSPILLDK